MKTKKIMRSCVRRACPDKKWHEGCDLLMDDILPQTFNMSLKECKRLKHEGEPMLSFYDMCHSRFFDRVRNAIPELRKFSARIPKDMFRRLGIAIESYKAGIRGMPRYKSATRSINSFTVPSGGCVIRRSGYKHPKDWRTKANGPHWGVHIKGLGFCRFKGSPPKGRIIEVTVQRTAKRVNFIFTVERTIPAHDCRDEPVTGIDVGTKDMITTSTGEKISGMKRDLERIKELDRKMARQKKGSKSYEKTRISRQKEWQSITDSEKGFLHRLTTDLVRRIGPNFAMEEKVASSLLKKRKGEGKKGKKKNREILEQSWGQIARMIGYKAEEAGGWLREVNPAYTSLDCHQCGGRKKKKDLPLSDPDRMYDCESCSLLMDRDENGAINIALRSIGKKPGRAEPGGIRLRCSSKQSEQDQSRKSASSRLQAAVPFMGMGVHGGDNQVSGSYA